VVIKSNTITGKNCNIKSGTYLRNGVFLSAYGLIGANREIKQRIIFIKSRIANLNYVENSIIENDVNLEASSVLTNHFNERANKNIVAKIGDTLIDTKTTKFSSVLGNGCRIGTKAVLNPNSILEKDSIRRRLHCLTSWTDLLYCVNNSL